MTGRGGVSLSDAGLALPGRASGTVRCLRLAGTVRNSVPRWRKGWDSNPRWTCAHDGFQDRCLKPLGHPSGAMTGGNQPACHRGMGACLAGKRKESKWQRWLILRHRQDRPKTYRQCLRLRRRHGLAAWPHAQPLVQARQHQIDDRGGVERQDLANDEAADDCHAERAA